MHAKSLIISVVLPHVANIMNKYALIQPYGGVDYLLPYNRDITCCFLFLNRGTSHLYIPSRGY